MFYAHLHGGGHVGPNDAVWIYGDPAVYDAVRENGFPDEIAAEMEYTCYLDQCAGLTISEQADSETALLEGLPPGRLALCLIGGGQDGGPLGEAFARAKLPADMIGVILTGPYMPAEARRSVRGLAAANPRIRLLELIPEPTRVVRDADRVIAMGGYNSTSGVLSFAKESLLIPRVEPRRERIIRADKLRDLDLLDMLHPEELTPDALDAWLARDAAPRRSSSPTA